MYVFVRMGIHTHILVIRVYAYIYMYMCVVMSKGWTGYTVR